MKSVVSAVAIAATFALAGPVSAAQSQDDLKAQIKALKEENAALQKKIDALKQAKTASNKATSTKATSAPAEARTNAAGQPKPIRIASVDPGQCRAPGVANAFQIECAGLSIYVGAMTMQRQQTSNSAIVTPPTGTPGVLISGANFNPEWGWSPEAILRYRFNNGWSVEGRYFNNRPPAATYNVPSVTSFRISGIGVTILGGGSLDSSYRSDLESVEFNVQKEIVSGVSLLAGYRHFNFNEKLAITGAGINLSTWDESSRLDGAQIGAKFAFWAPVLPIRFDTTAKLGVYQNSSSNTLTSGIVSGANGSQHPTSYSAEANLSASYYFTPQLSLQATYTALWLSNLALADRAASTTAQVPGGTSSPVNLGNVWYNGVSVRLGYDF